MNNIYYLTMEKSISLIKTRYILILRDIRRENAVPIYIYTDAKYWEKIVLELKQQKERKEIQEEMRNVFNNTNHNRLMGMACEESFFTGLIYLPGDTTEYPQFLYGMPYRKRPPLTDTDRERLEIIRRVFFP